MPRITTVYGVPPNRKRRVKIGRHNGGIGSQFDSNIRKKYAKLGWKNFKSVNTNTY